MIFPEFGARCEDNKVSFAVFAPYAKSVFVRVYESDESDLPVMELKMKPVGRGCFEATADGNCEGMYYTYVVNGVETIDPYARSAGANSKRGLILKEGSADPEGWEEDRFEPKTPIVWEVHVRDLSSDKSLALPDAGKYSAFRIGESLDGKPVLVDYIKQLGVTYVQLLPVLDFGSVDELGNGYNWGYDPMCYFVPEGSYSSDPHDGYARVRELKRLVQTLHSAGIGVILDVVYNHTYFKKGNALDVCAPDYYYRMRDGKPCNGSGCGNETRSESAMFGKLMVDSVTYLAKEYHIDGFRFDLMGLHDVGTMNRIRRALDTLFEDGRGKKILMYGEPWYCEPPYGVKGADKQNLHLLDERIGVFNDDLRNALRGGHFGGATKGYAQGVTELMDVVLGGISAGIAGKKNADIKSPIQQVVYAACHDNYTLFDQLVASTDDNEDRRRMQKMVGFLLMSALGIPFLQAGEEFLRTKGGDSNSYKSGDDVNKLDWRRMIAEWDTVQYYKGLIEIRRSEPAFDDLSAADNAFSLLESPKGTAAYVIGRTAYAVNNTDSAFVVDLGRRAQILADMDRAGTTAIAECDGKLKVAPHSVIAARI